MAWGFEVVCPDCGHSWEGLEASLQIGLWFGSDADSFHEQFQDIFCPRCYLRLFYPRSIERKTWRRWIEQVSAETLSRSAFLRTIAERVEASLGSAGWYVPKALNLGEVACPECAKPMVPGERSGDRLVCPRCGGQGAVLLGFTCHASILLGPDGFS